MHVNTAKRQDEVKFVYLRGARALRPDLVERAVSETIDIGGRRADAARSRNKRKHVPSRQGDRRRRQDDGNHEAGTYPGRVRGGDGPHQGGRPRRPPDRRRRADGDRRRRARPRAPGAGRRPRGDAGRRGDGADQQPVQALQPRVQKRGHDRRRQRREGRRGHGDRDRRAVRGRERRAGHVGGAGDAGARRIDAARRRVQAADVAVQFPRARRGRPAAAGAGARGDGAARSSRR